jgi:hypothetical protein
MVSIIAMLSIFLIVILSPNVSVILTVGFLSQSYAVHVLRDQKLAVCAEVRD